MTFLKNLWRDLVDKRLWPVAVALLLGLIAVPFLIDTGSSAPVATTVAATPGVAAPQAAAQIAVAGAPGGAEVKRAGASRDPFRPLVYAKVPSSQTIATAGVGAAANTTAGATSAPAGRTSPSGTGGPAPTGTRTPTPTPPPARTPTAPATKPSPPTTTTKTRLYSYAISVAVKRAGRMTTRRGLRAITYLPSGAYPLVTFLGVKADGQTATFLLSSGVGVLGPESHCQPAAAQCAVIELKAGENVLLARAPKPGEPVKRFRLIVRHVGLREVVPVTPAAAARKRATTRAAATPGPAFPIDLAPSRLVTRSTTRR